MDVKEAIYGRRAIRDYRAESIDQAVLEALIDAAIQAPSAMNGQPWAFYVVRDAALLDRISREAKDQLLRTSPAGLASHHFEEMLSDERFHIFYHAPALIVICATQDSVWAPIDCTLAAQNLMLMAHAVGLGSCWIGFAQGWLESAEGRAALGIPQEWKALAPIIVGHPAATAAAPARRSPEIRWHG